MARSDETMAALVELTDAQPFLKWAGGKRNFLVSYGRSLPTFEGRYIEPFLGGGAVFFYLARQRVSGLRAQLGDVNKHLIRAYVDLRDRPEDTIAEFEEIKRRFYASDDKAKYYLEQRRIHNDRHPECNTPRFIFLNRTCWNGLWRVNKKGQFNVPYGAPKGERTFPSARQLHEVSTALQGVSVRCATWETTLASAAPGDFVFADPPYFSDLSTERGRSQQKYHREPFTIGDHGRLAGALSKLSERGVDFVLTNSDSPEMRELYSSFGFDVQRVSVPRYINSNVEARHGIQELVVTPRDKPSDSLSASAVLELESFRIKRHLETRSQKGRDDA